MVEENEDYNVKDNLYSERDIEISYPQISEIKNAELQSKINKLLKDEAFREYWDKVQTILAGKSGKPTRVYEGKESSG